MTASSVEALYEEEADIVQVTAAAALAPAEIHQLADGRAAIVNGMDTIDAGESYGARVKGVFACLAASATTFAVDDHVYWDASANLCVPVSASLDGSADFYLGICRRAKSAGQFRVLVDFNAIPPAAYLPNFVPELDLETGVDSAEHICIPAAWNKRGMYLEFIRGEVSEVLAGGDEDQGVITVYDTDDNSLITITFADAGADAVGDVRLGYQLSGATVGDAMKFVAAGKGVYAKVTTPTSGAGAAGKAKVHVRAVPRL